MSNTQTYVELGALGGILVISGLMVVQGAVEEASTILVAMVSFIFGNRYGRSSGASEVYMQLQHPVESLSKEKKPKNVEKILRTKSLSSEDAMKLKALFENKLNETTNKKKRLKLIELMIELGAYIESKGGTGVGEASDVNGASEASDMNEVD